VRILASADLHGVRPVYDWLLETAREYHVDAIVLAGDLLGYPDGFDTPEAAQHEEARATLRMLTKAAAPVLYIMGNDDLVELNSLFGQVQSIHARVLRCGSYNFVGYQYALPFMGGIFEKADDEIASDLAGLTKLMGDRTVFVSHSPAHGLLDQGMDGERIGSVAIQKFLAKHPYHAHIHGHCHEEFGRVGNHFNVASARQRRAMIIDLDTLTHQIVDARAVT
jgi:Icc-related predicted phosphoesterase